MSNEQELFVNQSNKNISFKFVPTAQDQQSKSFLIIDAENKNKTAYKDPTSGILTFCLAGNK